MIETRWTDGFGGGTRLDLMVEGRAVSHIEGIVPYTLRFGRALVPADGISGVGTEEDCRHRGYAAQVMTAAVSQMASGEAALSFLLGIQDFYHRFGYVPAGPSNELAVATTANVSLTMPPGFSVRLGMEADLSAIQALYECNSQLVVGAAVRPATHFVWKMLRDEMPKGVCRVVIDARGTVVGSAWLARDCWAVSEFAQGREENALIIGEALAAGPQSAVAVIAACRAWADEEAVRRQVPLHQVRMPLPPVGPIADAIKFHHSFAQQRYVPNGGFMARVINVQRLLTALAPELRHRAVAAGLSGTLTLRTEIGEGFLALVEGTTASGGSNIVVDLPQTSLARMVFGAMSAAAILDHDGVQVSRAALDLLGVLFPYSYPHIYLPDRC